MHPLKESLIWTGNTSNHAFVPNILLRLFAKQKIVVGTAHSCLLDFSRIQPLNTEMGKK